MFPHAAGSDPYGEDHQSKRSNVYRGLAKAVPQNNYCTQVDGIDMFTPINFKINTSKKIERDTVVSDLDCCGCLTNRYPTIIRDIYVRAS